MGRNGGNGVRRLMRVFCRGFLSMNQRNQSVANLMARSFLHVSQRRSGTNLH